MAHFQRSTKTRTTAQTAELKTVLHFAAYKEPALQITWIANDGKDYSLCLYGTEVQRFIDMVDNAPLHEYSSSEVISARCCVQLLRLHGKDIDVTIGNLDSKGDKYRLKFEKIDPLI